MSDIAADHPATPHPIAPGVQRIEQQDAPSRAVVVPGGGTPDHPERVTAVRPPVAVEQRLLGVPANPALPGGLAQPVTSSPLPGLASSRTTPTSAQPPQPRPPGVGIRRAPGEAA